MGADVLWRSLRWSLITLLFAWCLPVKSSAKAADGVEVHSVSVEVTQNEVHLRLSVVNSSARPVFLAGTNFKRSRPTAIFLEQWREGSGWTAVAPCLDVSAGDAIRLDPGKTLASGYDLKVIPPKRGVCTAPDLRSGGRFRYLLVYFVSQKQARSYAENVHSASFQPRGARVAFSEPFEVPPPERAPARPKTD